MKHLIICIFMYISLFSSLSNGQYYNRSSTRACGDCQPEKCPIPRQCLAGNSLIFILKKLLVFTLLFIFPQNSKFNNWFWFLILGYVPDRCGCCQICARLEHELCDISPEENRYGICGENLECRSRKYDGGVI